MVRVCFFASLREAVGRAEIEIRCEPASTAADVFRLAAMEFPVLEQFRRATLVAVNESYGNWDSVVSPGDEVAFFPPVSGG
jgi:sulfur-carrier protein